MPNDMEKYMDIPNVMIRGFTYPLECLQEHLMLQNDHIFSKNREIR